MRKNLILIKLPTTLIFLFFACSRFAVNTSGLLENEILTKHFKLISKQEKFILQILSDEEKRQITIPREWLIPPEDEKKEEHAYVSSFNFDEKITSFPVGNGQTGLHLSSFDCQRDGSAQAGAGRDIFLIYDPQSFLVAKGLDLGATKMRIRYHGCFEARFSHFVLSDINKDGLIDIGVFKEEIKCEIDIDGIPKKGSFYELKPVQWHVFKRNHWEHDFSYDGNIPEQYSELPLIGIIMSPIDFVAYVTWKSYDPSKWSRKEETPLKYIPCYRRKLIEGNLKKKQKM